MTNLTDISLDLALVLLALGVAVGFLFIRFMSAITGKSSCDDCCLLSKPRGNVSKSEKTKDETS